MKTKKLLKTCNHNLNVDNTTLQILPLRQMVTPQRVYAQCGSCKEIFVFQKNENGHYEMVTKEVEDADDERDGSEA